MEIWGGNEPVDTALSVPGLDIWVYSKPYGGSVQGGDIHYVSLCGAGNIARLAIADVSGHGEQVSKAAIALRSLMRKNINTLDQSRFARALNESFQMYEPSDSTGHYATALLATYWAPTDHLLLVNAGHPRPLMYCARERSWFEVDAETAGNSNGRVTRERAEAGDQGELPSNLPIGMLDPTAYTQIAVKLEPGDLILIVTDGVTESRAPGGSELGSSGLLEMVRTISIDAPGEFLATLRERLRVYTGDAAAIDDVTMAILHHNATTPPKQSIGEHLRVIGRMLGFGKM